MRAGHDSTIRGQSLFLCAIIECVGGDWWELEAEARSRGRELDRGATALCDRAFELLSQGIVVMSNRPTSSQGQRLALLALTQAANTGRVAWETVFVGYYTQAMMSMRMIRDYWVIARFAREDPEAATKWLTTSRERIGDLMAKLVAGSARAHEEMHAISTLLNRFAHADSYGIHMAYENSEAGWALRAGPSVNRTQFVVASAFAMQFTILIVDELGRQILAQDGIDEHHTFLSRVAVFVDDAADWLAKQGDV